MTRRILATAVTLIAATALSAYAFGGWAVISMEDFPERLQVGGPNHLTFTIRQHGVEPMGGLQPTVEARNGGMIGGTMVEARAVPGRKTGQYTAALTLPKAGEWKLTIKSGFGPSNLTLLPMQATDPNVKVAALSEGDRGKQLYVAKGCVTCHVNDRADSGKGIASDFGPNLTEKAYDPAFLAMWLANPKIKPPTKPGQEMPNLGLSKTEIAAISMFINKGTTPAAKQHE